MALTSGWPYARVCLFLLKQFCKSNEAERPEDASVMGIKIRAEWGNKLVVQTNQNQREKFAKAASVRCRRYWNFSGHDSFYYLEHFALLQLA